MCVCGLIFQNDAAQTSSPRGSNTSPPLWYKGTGWPWVKGMRFRSERCGVISGREYKGQEFSCKLDRDVVV